MGDGVVLMGRVVHLPSTKDEIQVVQSTKDTVVINGVEYVSMDLEEFINTMEISPEAEEKFIRGLFQLIKEECLSNWKVLKIFKEIFKR